MTLKIWWVKKNKIKLMNFMIESYDWIERNDAKWMTCVIYASACEKAYNTWLSVRWPRIFINGFSNIIWFVSAFFNIQDTCV